MKSYLLGMGTLLLPALFLISCAEDERLDSQPDQFTFSFIPHENNGGRIAPVDLPNGAALVISLELNNGTVILEDHQMALRKEGERYVTEPVKLTNGNYKITDFMIVDDSFGVLYATPRKGSPLSAEILQSLPYSFQLDGNNASDLSVEVVDARAKSPKSFGYDSFRKKNHPWKLQVFIPDGPKMQMTTAEAFIMKGLDTVQIYPLAAKMNTLPFNGDPASTYTLVVIKDSYSRFSRDFTMNTISKNPLKVVLEPALTVVAIPVPDQNYFGMQFDTWYSYDFTVDWGDGSSTTWTTGITIVLDHYYEQPGKYFISITGHALDSVLTVGDLYGGGDIERLGLNHLTNLFDFRIEWADGPKVIDLSHSTFLSEVRIFTAAVEDLIIPDNARIYIFEIIGDTNLKLESLNEIINDIHHQVVNSPPHSGDFAYHLAEDFYTPILEPSPEALAKLRDLRDNHHWFIWPDGNL
jgi:hypothetical protein